jgi:glucokinase
MKLAPEATPLCGIDLGGTSIKIAIANSDGAILHQGSTPTLAHEGPDAVLDRIVEHVEAAKAKVGVHDVSGIGVGVPGLVDVAAGVTKFLPNFPTQWRDVPVVDTLYSRLKCPVRILNDARTATLGELRFGRGKGIPNLTMAFFSIGTGVGGGVVVDGKLRLGPLGSAGELGHQTIAPDGPLCGCGNRGCLETLASGPAIAAEGVRLMNMGMAPRLHEIVEGNADRVTAKEMMVAAGEDDAISDAIRRAAAFVGIAVANVVTVLHPDLIVLGGGVANLGAILSDTVREGISHRVGMFPTDQIQVECSGLGDRAGVMGAIALAGEELWTD